MIKGIYTSASGMIPRLKKQESIANNLANAATAGYKKDQVFTHELSRAERKMLPKKSDWEQPMIDEVYTSFVPGVFDKTGNPTDMAIDGDGFFRLELDDGSQLLTRSGSFEIDADGFLSFPGGARVMSESGALEIGDGAISVGADGTIQSDGASVGRIVPVTVEDLTVLEKVGSTAFRVPDGTPLIPVETSTVQQGFLEASNVDVVREMIDMIISFRNYEADAKAIQTQDQSLDHLFNRVAPKG